MMTHHLFLPSPNLGRNQHVIAGKSKTIAAHQLEAGPYQSLRMLCLGIRLFHKYLLRVYYVAGAKCYEKKKNYEAREIDIDGRGEVSFDLFVLNNSNMVILT